MSQDQLQTSSAFLETVAYMKMPFGKYKNQYLSDIPESYFIWFKTKGFPKGKLGEMMAFVYELKINGLEYILKKIRV